MDQRYTWAAPASARHDATALSKGSISVNANRRPPNSVAPDPLILSQSSFLDRYARDPSVHFMPDPRLQPHLQQQQHMLPHPVYQMVQLQQQLPPTTAISDKLLCTDRANGYPLCTNIHQIPIPSHQIPAGPTDVSEFRMPCSRFRTSMHQQTDCLPLVKLSHSELEPRALAIALSSDLLLLLLYSIHELHPFLHFSSFFLCIAFFLFACKPVSFAGVSC